MNAKSQAVGVNGAETGGGFGPLLEGIAETFGYDFRGYARPALDRRIRGFIKDEGLPDAAALRERIATDPQCISRFISRLSHSMPSMFSDAPLFALIRREIIPNLRTYPFIRIWHPGCSTGQEVYSLAILMKEEGLLHRCRIYATDIDDSAVRAARNGIFPLQSMRRYTANYLAAGGKSAFSEYYTAKYNNAIITAELRKNIVFANHNLVSDGSFNEFHFILCNNVLGRFTEPLQRRVHGLFHQSLAMFGYLGLGPKESLDAAECKDAFRVVDEPSKIYRKIA